jgi:hypothetical protein
MNFSERPIVFGVRWQAKRDTALGEDIPTVHAPQTFEIPTRRDAALQSSLRFASAGCRRNP